MTTIRHATLAALLAVSALLAALAMTTSHDHDQGNEVSDLHHAAIILVAYILQGRIRPTHDGDMETETLLAHLVLLAGQQEPKPAPGAGGVPCSD